MQDVLTMGVSQRNSSVIDQALLQLSTLALNFALKWSIIGNKYIDRVPSRIQKLLEVELAWLVFCI